MKTILISGSTAGFGLAIATLLGKEKHRLILVGRRSEKLAELEQSLDTKVFTITADVTNSELVKTFFDSLPEDYRKVDMLINNAGLALGLDPAQEADLQYCER